MLVARKHPDPLNNSVHNQGKLDFKHLKQASSAMQTVMEETFEIREDEKVDEEVDEENGEEDDICSSYTSKSSIPDDNIDFELVYARHTFIATIDGQASVVKGDTMTLIDDSNSYWWLIRALKTSEVGYIPAELVETPQERLARLNKHRNIEVTSANRVQYFHCEKPSSTSSDVTNTEGRTEKTKKRVQLSRTLCCQKQVLDDSDDNDDNDDSNVYSVSYVEYTEDMPLSAFLASEHDESFAKSGEEGKKKDKYAPLINPYFNKPITAVSTTATLITDIAESPVDNPAQSSLSTSVNSRNTRSEGHSNERQLLPNSCDASTAVEHQDNNMNADSNQQCSNTPAFLYPTLPPIAAHCNVIKENAPVPYITTAATRLTPPSPPLSPPEDDLDFGHENIFMARPTDHVPDNDHEILLLSERQPDKDIRTIVSTGATTKSANNAVSGLKRLLSFGKKSNVGGSNKVAAASASNTTVNEHSLQHVNSREHYHVLRIFAGNSIQTGTSYNTVTITPEMSADDLLKCTLQKFHISLIDDAVTSSGIEYYLSVKSMDSDEITLMPQDKPLSIFKSLSDHLTEPMPSLKTLKRLSKEQPSIQITRVGVSKARKRAQARFGDDSLIRFSLHKRIKRIIDETDCQVAEQMYIKLCFYADEALTSKVNTDTSIAKTKKSLAAKGGLSLLRKSSLSLSDSQSILSQQRQQHIHSKATEKGFQRERFEKLVPVSITTTMRELVSLALDKFHVDAVNAAYYYIALSQDNEEVPLEMHSTIADALNDTSLGAKGCSEKLFVLRSQSMHARSSIEAPAPCSLTGADTSSRAKEANGVEAVDVGGRSFMRCLLPNNRSDYLVEKQTAKFAHQRPILVNLPARSNSLSIMSTATGDNKSRMSPVTDNPPAHYEHRKLPMRSSSLRIHTIKSLEGSESNLLSASSSLQRELEQIKI